jgi:uncharacterized membrane protein YphA (DoxX/SURF4 family)
MFPAGIAVAPTADTALLRATPLHVDYVTPGDASDAVVDLFGPILSDPLSVTLLLAGAVAALVALASAPWIVRLPDVQVAQRTLASYRPYLPWMLRLSLGLPLVGAGFNGYFVSPSVPVSARLFQVAVGFLLLFGLATRATALVGLLGYLAVLPFYPDLLLSSEYVGGFLAIVVVGAGQPSADGLVRRLSVTDGTLTSRIRPTRFGLAPVLQRVGLDGSAVGPILRAALGANFVYLGLTQKLLNSGAALAVVEKYDLTGVVPVQPELWVVGAGLAEIAVGLLLVSGVATRGVAGIAFLLFTTTLFGLPDDPVLAHVSLFGLASALMVTGSGPYAVSVGRLSDRLRSPFGGGAERSGRSIE